jgi:3-phenylpropionate/trans-cinnamate dioxygenase ferredoxin component
VRARVKEKREVAESSTYLIAGPPAMVDGVLATLQAAGVPERQVRSDRFGGIRRHRPSCAGRRRQSKGGRQMGELTTVAALDELANQELAAFDVIGKRIAIARVDDAFYAFGDTCTHQGCSLADGELDGATVTCPCHGSQFNVTTGDVLRGPARESVRSYPVRLEAGALRVEV